MFYQKHKGPLYVTIADKHYGLGITLDTSWYGASLNILLGFFQITITYYTAEVNR